MLALTVPCINPFIAVARAWTSTLKNETIALDAKML